MKNQGKEFPSFLQFQGTTPFIYEVKEMSKNWKIQFTKTVPLYLQCNPPVQDHQIFKLCIKRSGEEGASSSKTTGVSNEFL